ncbi:MAG: hypothetical protein Q7S09_03830, partial [bacterium]|nr:hypothetical protein [bacterium]
MTYRIRKAISLTTTVTTTLWMTGAAFLMPVASHAAVTINDGDIFRASNDYKVYIAKYVGGKMFKRWFVGPQMFDFYRHLSFAVVKVVDPSVAASYTESKLVRVDGDQKVWYIGNAVAGQGADKQWVTSLAAFQAAGFDWDGVYIINSAEGNWYSMGANFNGAPSPSTSGGPVAGSISASLASDNPAGAVIAAASVYNPVLKVTLWAPSSGGATISGITISKGGLLANTNVSGVSVWDAGVRHGSVVSSISSDNKVTIGFGSNPITLAAGESRTLTVSVNIASGVTSGTVYFGLASASDIQANTTVGGAFPLNGNLFSISSGALGDVYVAAVSAGGNSSSTASGNVDVGELQKEIGKFKFTQNNGTEDIQVESLTVYVEGDLTETKDVLNWKLYDASGNVLATTARPYDRYVTFNLATPYVIAKGLNRTLSVKADFMDGAGRWTRVHLQNDYDMMIRGTGTRAFILPLGSAGGTFADTVDANPYFRMRSGSMTVTKNSSSPSGQLAVGSTDVLLAKFTIRASGEDMEVRKMDLHIAKTQAETALTGNVAVRSEDGSATYVTISATTGTAIYGTGVNGTADLSTRYDLSTYIQLKSNVDKIIAVYGNVSSAATASDSYQAGVGNFYVKRISSIDYTDLPDTTTQTLGNDLAVITTAATVAKNTAFG